MLTKLSKNVVCVKDIPSNLIEEAFFILKSNKMQDRENAKKREDIIASEVNEMIAEYSKQIQMNETEYQKSRQKEIQKIKGKVMLCISIFAIICFIVTLVKL